MNTYSPISILFLIWPINLVTYQTRLYRVHRNVSSILFLPWPINTDPPHLITEQTVSGLIRYMSQRILHPTSTMAWYILTIFHYRLNCPYRVHHNIISILFLLWPVILHVYINHISLPTKPKSPAVWACLGVDPLYMPRTPYRASEGKRSQ